ncbi:MAG: hypothetical protein KAH72_05675, partial [Flavobacteriaceae bacterium]|nr:hypothetical protein [Flavobacteriaceae bacterium]
MDIKQIDIKQYYKDQRKVEWRTDIRKGMKTKERVAMTRTKMLEQDPKIRNKNGKEVNLGLTERLAIEEAKRCIDCPDPTCISGCPVNIYIPKFIKKIEVGDFLGAAKIIKETNSLPAVCGRVCPQEKQCEAQCFYSIKLNQPP